MQPNATQPLACGLLTPSESIPEYSPWRNTAHDNPSPGIHALPTQPSTQRSWYCHTATALLIQWVSGRTHDLSRASPLFIPPTTGWALGLDWASGGTICGFGMAGVPGSMIRDNLTRARPVPTAVCGRRRSVEELPLRVSAGSPPDPTGRQDNRADLGRYGSTPTRKFYFGFGDVPRN